MERRAETKIFQPHIVASFTKPQMESVAAWLTREVLTNGRTFDSALETVELDEKGKVMNEKNRNRLRYGLSTINILYKEGVRLDQIRGTIQVWQKTPDENKLEIDYAIQTVPSATEPHGFTREYLP